ncbi:hypothetical protein [Burkholderia ubonensis]|uniref:hypothetical protein n=1 Tax=Burkholderia ubonensis TaxID=101571 RepID=UPI0012FB011D|nr:hypothetical protein [Burkholderia ubonensis]
MNVETQSGLHGERLGRDRRRQVVLHNAGGATPSVISDGIRARCAVGQARSATTVGPSTSRSPQGLARRRFREAMTINDASACAPSIRPDLQARHQPCRFISQTIFGHLDIYIVLLATL